MELEKVLLSRKSCRAYTEKPVEAEKLEKVVVAGSLAPLGLPKAGKPHLTVVTDKALLDRLAYIMGPDRNTIYGAPVLVIVSCPEAPAPGIAEMNAACLVEMMSLMATDQGLGNIYLYGVTAGLQKDEALKAALGIPAGFTPLSALALGYGAEDVAVCKEFKEVLSRNDV